MAARKSALFNLAFACVGENAKAAFTLRIRNYWMSAKFTTFNYVHSFTLDTFKVNLSTLRALLVNNP